MDVEVFGFFFVFLWHLEFSSVVIQRILLAVTRTILGSLLICVMVLREVCMINLVVEYVFVSDLITGKRFWDCFCRGKPF